MNIRLSGLILGCVAGAGFVPGLPISAVAQEHKQLSDLPTLYITTENSAPIVSKEDYVTATLVWVDADGETTYENNLGIRGRGNSTWGLKKKPYRIKFDKKTEFLGPERAKAKSWTLLANYADKSLIRNAVASCIGSFAGQPFTAAAKFVDVVLNGEYLGNYQISDQMEIREKRVNITEQEDPATEDSNITGGYFLEVDGFAYEEPVYFTTPRGVTITVKSPDEEIINDAQKKYISDYVAAFENALYSADFKDPEKGYRRYVDPSTLASWYISSELTGNVDAFWSTYIYKEKDDDKIYWGPLWDYDIAFNNCDRVGDVSRSLMTEKGFGDNLTNVWVKRMWQDPWFANLINDTWRDLVAKGIESHVNAYIDEMAAHLEKSQQLNFQKWRINQHVYNELVLFSTYKEGIDYLKKFITDHVAYLTTAFQSRVDNLPATTDPSAPFELDDDYSYRILNKGNLKSVGINGTATELCIATTDSSDESQEWILTENGNFVIITSRKTGKVITDVAAMNGTAYAGGSTLALKERDAEDMAQQWLITPISTGASYCLINRQTSLAWNNNGGSSEDGNPVISWTNDGENENKVTRQWHLNKATKLTSDPDPDPDPEPEPEPDPEPGPGDGIDDIQAGPQYYVSYLPDTHILRFVSEGDVNLEGNVEVYSMDGVVVAAGKVSEEIDLSGVIPGNYVVTWVINGKRHSVKFVR